MSLPGHRRTSSHKRRRASHFALVKPNIVIAKSGAAHLGHRVAPNATEYNGITIHVKGRERKLQKLMDKTRMKTEKAEAHDHDHAGHNHA
ncbi:50S ribosomal protein L32 [Patescibacteria group bacterium]|nr:50S ribosomal protein L32 [Patescibacteria group bacterium]